MPIPRRLEPRSVTLGDLVALVVGVAIVIGTPWANWPEFVRGVGVWGRLSDPQAWAIGAEVLGKACLAMLPVILVRATQYRRAMRPGEFLAACAGMPWLSWGIERLLYLDWLTRRHGYVIKANQIPVGDSRAWVELVYWPWHLTLLAIAVGSLAVIALGRKRLPHWILAAAAMLAWLGLRDSGMSIMRRLLLEALDPLARAGKWGMVSLIYHTLTDPIFDLLYVWPIVVAVMGPRREGRKRTWVQWICTGLASAGLAGEIVVYLLGAYVLTRPFHLAELALDVFGLVGAFAVTVVLYGRLRLAWSHPLDVGYDGGDPASPPLEA